MRRFVILGAFLFTGLAALAVPEPAAAVIRYVTADGTDSGTCGTLAAPCRSITQGIARAGTSDHILVGPGHYGPVVLSKAVTLESSAGAAATVITDPNVGGTAVRITAVGALFGTPDKGFTVRGAAEVGVAVLSPGAVVRGNVLESNVTGITVGAAGVQTEIDGNSILNSGSSGIIVAATATVSRNALSGNGTGGILVVAPDVVITSNNFTGNGVTDGSNCGVLTVAPIAVNAERNYWGRTQGPGADPGDRVCGVGTVDTVPFLTKAVVISTTTGR